MDVKDKISDKDKQKIVELASDCNSLTRLFHIRHKELQELVHDVLIVITPNPDLYTLQLDTWELKLKASKLIVLGGQLPKNS